MQTAGRYCVTNYFQKSTNFLFPLIAKSKQEGVSDTFLFADGIEDDIVNNIIFCEIEKETSINKDLEEFVKEVYETEDDTFLYKIDIASLGDAQVNQFLSGSYSEYSEEAKKKILFYFQWTKSPGGVVYTPTEVKAIDKKDFNPHYHVLLYPKEFKINVAQDMHTELDLFDTKEEALEIIRDMKELCEIYNYEKETYKKPLRVKHAELPLCPNTQLPCT